MEQRTTVVAGPPRRHEDFDELRSALRGDLVVRGGAGYDEARKVYNAMIDRYPRAIARCHDGTDVLASVRFARRHRLTVSVRCGGHNAAGLGVADDALVIDLSEMRGVQVDPRLRTVRVQGGCRLSDVDQATHAYGLAVPSGVLSSTGVGGLTLGGGTGHLTRRYGLTIDNLLSADVVLADGTSVIASEDSHPDLFWALKGGGGNFGIVTEFEFRAHPVKDVVAGPVLFPIERLGEIMRVYRDWCPKATVDMTAFFATFTVPPADPFPAELHGHVVCGIVACYLGPPEAAEAVLSPFLERDPTFAHVGLVPFPAVQALFDPLYPSGYQWYWRADFVRELTDEAIDSHAEFSARMPSALSTMHLYPIDGAVHRVAPEDTAFRFRDVKWSEVIIGIDPDPARAKEITQWTKDYHDAVHPYGAGAAYVNFLMNEGEDRVKATYGENYARLTDVKRRYDPENFFHVNQNIRPEPS
jgi:FAD/FMN-containing dehydrogenase